MGGYKMNLVDKLGYYMEHIANRDDWCNMFSVEEVKILDVVYEFNRLRATMTGENDTAGMEATLQRVEQEKSISFQLKEAVFEQINKLLSKESIEAWYDIFAWYQWLTANQLSHRFWEFHMLKLMLDIFVAELKEFYSNGSFISVLTLHSMAELAEVYFTTIFLLRRIEYEVEPVDEIIRHIDEYKLSPIYIMYIVQEAKINDKDKVIKTVENWCWK